MTPERKAEVEALLDDILGPEPEPQPPKPKLVAETGIVVRDVETAVAPGDPNAQRRGGETRVSVRRAPALERPLPPLRLGEVRVDMAAYTARRLIEEADREADRAHRRAIDPFGYGHWGPRDE